MNQDEYITIRIKRSIVDKVDVLAQRLARRADQDAEVGRSVVFRRAIELFERTEFPARPPTEINATELPKQPMLDLSSAGAAAEAIARGDKHGFDEAVARKNPHIGSTLDSFLDEEGIKDEVYRTAGVIDERDDEPMYDHTPPDEESQMRRYDGHEATAPAQKTRRGKKKKGT